MNPIDIAEQLRNMRRRAILVYRTTPAGPVYGIHGTAADLGILTDVADLLEHQQSCLRQIAGLFGITGASQAELVALVRRAIADRDDAQAGESAAQLAAEQRAAAQPADRMSSVAKRKAADLAASGYEVAGYVLVRDGDRSAVLWDAAVRWITPAERHRLMHVEGSLIDQPAAARVPLTLTDGQLDRAVAAWFEGVAPPADAGYKFRTRMRAAIEAASREGGAA